MKKNLIERGKKLIYWYSKEKPLYLLPFIFFSLFIWILVANATYKFLNLKKKEKKKKVIAFTSLYYNGNAKAVYEYMRKDKNYMCYWIARNRRSFLDVKRGGGYVVYCYFPFVEAKHILNTDAVVTNDSFLLILFPHKPKTIQLWHGVGPKGIEGDDYTLCDARCVSSRYTKRRHIELWNAPPEKLYVTGFARMDFLYNYLKIPKEKLLEEIKIKNNRKIILYAPTFDIGLWPWGNPYKEFEKLCKWCEENKLTLILRLHPLAKINKRRLKKLIKKYDGVYWLDMPKEPDTMKLLAVADILITDWSSIYTDYFLTKRPIIYLEVEPEYYTKKRGKPEIPPEYRAGEIVHNNEEFYKVLNIVLEEGNRHKEKQEELLKIIHGNVDGKASKRVAKVIEELLHRA